MSDSGPDAHALAAVRRFAAEGWTRRRNALVLCTMVYFGARLGTAALAALETEVVADLGITHGLFGLAITGLSLVSALVQLPSGALGDRFGERAIVLAAVVLTGSATVSVALSPSYAVFLPLVVAVGAGSGLYYSPATSLLDRLYDQTGQAIGTFRVGGQVAGATAPVLAGVIAVRAGWRGAILVAGLVLAPVAVALAVFMRPTEPRTPDASIREQLSVGRLRGLLSRREVATTTVLASLVQFVEVASFTFLPAILREYHDLPLVVVTVLYGAYFATVAVVQPVTGRLSDGFGRDRVIAATLFAGIVGYGLVLTAGSLPTIALGVCLAGVAMTWAAPVQARFVDQFAAGEQGTGFGLVRTLYLLVGALGSVVAGALATRFGWPTAIGALVCVLAASLLVLGVGRRIR